MRDLYFDEPQQPKTEKTTKEHKYTDEKGKHLYSVCRLDGPEGKRIWQKPAEGYQLRDVKHTVYNLPQIKASAGTKENLVLVAEGEKCCDAVADAFGLVCTTNSGGAGKWTDKQSEQLKGCEAVVLPDNDKPGIEHGSQVAESLHRHGIPCKIINLPGLAEKEDVADWIKAGGTCEQLTGLIDNVGYWEPEEQETRVYIPDWDNEPPEEEPLASLNYTKVLSRQNLMLIPALAGIGKTNTIAAMWAAGLQSFGCDTLGFSVSENLKMLLIDTEMSTRDSWVTKTRGLRRAGIKKGDKVPDRMQWINIRAIETPQEKQEYFFSLIDCDDSPDIVILDGAGDLISDVNNPEEVSSFVSKLCSILQRRNIGAVITLHTNPTDKKARGHLGSELWRKAESCIIIEKTDSEDIRMITTNFSMGKNRGASDDLSVFFRWDDELKMHVSCDQPTKSEKKGKTVLDRERIVSTMGKKSYTHKELTKLVMEVCGLKDRAARDRIDDLTTIEKISKCGNIYQAVNNA